ncbi:elongation of very long chain fatty acids protein 7-like [Lutzomyia longipalpis]|uniref:elongation of very long chain fatty acids protein 7-like n=1 Tax=Lutzomyia longipalpis TaxID=7200 RepID=UPI002483EE9F|nr:elongation of very long chain fatty acids protein 7-like [Lutzomyia longipalpis]
MALVLKFLYTNINYLFVEHEDARTKDFPIIHSLPQVIAIIASYLYFTKSWGPRFMESRKPYELKAILIIYNTLQVLANIWLGLYATYHSYWRGGWNFFCEPIRQDFSPQGYRVAFVVYCYYLLKVTDLLDTVFFVLRKKYNQITFLHVYHHAMMVFGTYIASKFAIAGHASMLGIVNCYVHAIMYMYYLISSFKPDMKKSIWWKKHITHVQMIQFTFLIFHFGRPLVMQDCDYPQAMSAICFVQNLFMLVLFSDFYRKAYLTKKKEI